MADETDQPLPASTDGRRSRSRAERTALQPAKAKTKPPPPTRLPKAVFGVSQFRCYENEEFLCSHNVSEPGVRAFHNPLRSAVSPAAGAAILSNLIPIA